MYLQSQSSSSPVPIAPQCESGLGFPLFLKLPIEIQTQIWLDALSPRVVEIRRFTGKWGCRVTFFTFAAGPIPLLHVCQYSRNIALKMYTLRCPDHSSVPAYLDDFRDVVLMDDIDVLELVLDSIGESRSFEGVRYVAIDPTYPLNTNPGVSGISTRSRSRRTTHDIPNRGISCLARAIKYFRSLQELFVLYPVSDGDEVPEWFVSNLHDLLETEAQDMGLEPRELPLITCLPYDSQKEGVGRGRALREWIEFAGYGVH